MEVHNIVQEAVIKTIPKKKKCKRSKWLSEKTLQRTEKRREVKRKGGKERYTHLNAECQRIARRAKKAFLSNQCTRNRGKQQNGKDQRSPQENQRYQGNISCKDGLSKGQKKQKILRRGGKNTQKNCTHTHKKIFTTQIITMV